MNRLSLAAATTLLMGVLFAPDASANDVVRYYRGLTTVREAIDRIEGRCRVRQHQAVLFVFEQRDFREKSERWEETRYSRDLPEWCREIEAWAARSEIRIEVCLTGSKKALAVQPGRSWLPALERDAQRIAEVVPRRWLRKLVRLPKSKQPALVYLAGKPKPDLLPSQSWNDKDVLRAARRMALTLYVIAPEARFTECLARPEIPSCLWPFTSVPEAFEPRFRGDINWFTYSWFGREEERSERVPETDCPGAFGFPAYTAGVALTDGAYLVYPARPSKWLDPCPRDEDLLRRVAPEPVRTKAVREAKRKDPALVAISEAGLMVERLEAKYGRYAGRDAVPWKDYRNFPKLAVRARGFAEGLEAVSAHLAKAQAAVAAGDWKGQFHRRSEAQLRYAAFLVAMRAFHLGEWAQAADEVPAFVEKGEGRERYKEKGLEVGMYSTRRFRLSDTLPPYAGAKSESGKVTLGPGLSFSFNLGSGERKKRPDVQVLKGLGSIQRARAERMIRAAREVMAHEAKTPWGWMTYYSDAHRFGPCWSGEWKGRPKRKQPPSLGEDPETKPERDEPYVPGSGGDGPTSGGK